MNYELRETSYEDDKRFLEELFFDVRAAEFAAMGLPDEPLKLLAALQFKAQYMGFAAEYPEADSFIVWAGAYRIGRLLIHETETEIRLVDVALLGAFRNSGVGTSILTQLQNHAQGSATPLRLTVRTGSLAVRLFDRLGFVLIENTGENNHMEWTASDGS